jgi:protein TonB
MWEIPPEDESSKSKSKPKPPAKPDPKPKPKPKPDPKPRHTAERERRQVKLAQNVRTRSPKDSSKGDDVAGVCGCLVIGIVGAAIVLAFFI